MVRRGAPGHPALATAEKATLRERYGHAGVEHFPPTQSAPTWQNGPFVRSHAAPSAARDTHVPFTHVPSVQPTFFPPTSPHLPLATVESSATHALPVPHRVPTTHGCDGPHDPPTPAGAMHVLLLPAHTSPGPH